MWPPTNAGQNQGMLYWLATLPGAYGRLGSPWHETTVPNFLGSGFTVVVIAAEFPDGDQFFNDEYYAGTEQNWGTGVGAWSVVYKQVSETFWDVVDHYEPDAILSFTRSLNNKNWELENVVRNNSWNRWWEQSFSKSNGAFAGTSGKPFVGGEFDDPATLVSRPNHGLDPKTGYPPDATLDATDNDTSTAGIRVVSLPTIVLMAQIKQTLELSFNSSQLNVIYSQMGNAPDNFVSAFVGYQSVWYSGLTSNDCNIGFHTHVGYNLPLSTCRRALCAQLTQTVIALGGIPNQPCPP